jgi:hypothetical protein
MSGEQTYFIITEDLQQFCSNLKIGWYVLPNYLGMTVDDTKKFFTIMKLISLRDAHPESSRIAQNILTLVAAVRDREKLVFLGFATFVGCKIMIDFLTKNCFHKSVIRPPPSGQPTPPSGRPPPPSRPPPHPSRRPPPPSRPPPHPKQ